MTEQMSIFQNLPWDIIALSLFCVFNFILVVKSQAKVRSLQDKQDEMNRHMLELAGDIKALYESGTTLGNKVKSLEYEARLLKEEQEKLSLKEPSQQMYRNAVQQINNGESVTNISASSGLSRGEVELLKLFQRINDESVADKMEKTPD